MGVYIENMEMPTNCMLCPLCVEEADPTNGEMCMVTGKLMPPCNRERLADCPLIPVPPHGRGIDADALLKKCEFVCTDDDEDIRAVRYSIIEEALTIIPATEGEK